MKEIRDLICHGKKDRCLDLFGYRLPICSRCTGFYYGMLIGTLFYYLFLDFGARILFIISVASLIPMSIDGGLQELTDHESTNKLRFFTGSVAGIFVGMDLSWIIHHI